MCLPAALNPQGVYLTPSEHKPASARVLIPPHTIRPGHGLTPFPGLNSGDRHWQ